MSETATRQLTARVLEPYILNKYNGQFYLFFSPVADEWGFSEKKFILLRKLQLLSRKSLCTVRFNLSENCEIKLRMLLMTYHLHEASCLLCQRTIQFFYKKSRKWY